MACVILIDMCDCFLYIMHNLDRKNVIQIFRSPVFLCRRNRTRHQFFCFLIGTHFDMLLFQLLCKNRKKFFFHIFMDQKRFTGIADTDSLRLGIHDDIDRHRKICTLIYINVAVSGSGLDHRDGALVYHCLNKPSSASRDQNIDIFIHFHEFCCRFTGGILNKLDGIFCHSMRT